MECRAANRADTGKIMDIIQQAKDHFRRQGIDQWQTGYPSLEVIEGDISSGNGYVLTEGEEVLGYVCIAFDGDEAYNDIQGAWKSIQPYAVVHRMAIDSSHKGKGLSSLIFRYAEQLCMEKGIHSIKIDTDKDNATMKHLLEKNGFEYCVIIQFEGSDKIAFEKMV